MAGSLRRLVSLIATTPDAELPSKLPLFPHRCLLLPVLSGASSVYKVLLRARSYLYQWGLLRKHRLPVPVISVGNLTWGGNGKTPMVEFLSRVFVEKGIRPLILTRGYAGGDEAKMLHRHFGESSAMIGVGVDRVATATSFLKKHGYMKPNTSSTKFFSYKCDTASRGEIGVVILDDGMQHWSLLRNLDIVMVNGMLPWGNNHLLPRGPLREPLDAFKRADVAVIHHADLVSDEQLKSIELIVRKVKELPIFFSRLVPLHFFEVKDVLSRLPLTVVDNMVVLCVSAIGCPNAFLQLIEKLGPKYIERLDFCDHHAIQSKDIDAIKGKIEDLEDVFGEKPIVVVTEKDYDRDPMVLEELDDFAEVLVVCSSLQIMSLEGQQEKFIESLMHLVKCNTTLMQQPAI